MSWLSFILGLMIFTSGGILFVKIFTFIKHYKEDINDCETKKTSNFINAKQLFVRDPNDFKDIDNDGIDDVIDDKK